MSYPSELSLSKKSEEWKFLTKHSELFETIDELSDDPVVLDADLLFQGDQRKWGIFVDLFFPELDIQPLFRFQNNAVNVIPSRGTRNDVEEIMDFLLVNTPQTMWNFADRQARKRVNAPQEQEERGLGVQAAPQAAAHNTYNNFANNWGWPGNNNGLYNNFNNEYENNYGPEIGYTEEEENALSHLRGQNARRYFPRQGGKKKTRKSKQSKRKTRRNKN